MADRCRPVRRRSFHRPAPLSSAGPAGRLRGYGERLPCEPDPVPAVHALPEPGALAHTAAAVVADAVSNDVCTAPS